MELEDEAGVCKGKVGKKGNKWLIENGATVESCQLACLDDEDCKFASLKKSGKPSKWKCASFKKCKKTKENKKYMTFKKSKVTAAKAAEQGKIWTEDGSAVPVPTPHPTKVSGRLQDLPEVMPPVTAETDPVHPQI